MTWHCWVGVFVLLLASLKVEVWLQAQQEAGLLFARGDFGRAVIHSHESCHPVMCWKTSTGLPPGCTGSGSALPHVISWTITSSFLCLHTLQFEKVQVGINLIILQFALAQRFLVERETLAQVLLGCLSLWSASQCESTGPTCPDRCTDSSGFLCENVRTSPPPCLSLSFPVPIFCSCLPCHCPPPGGCSPHIQHNPCLFLTGSAVWEDGGQGRWHPTLQPVHGSEFNFPEHPGSLPEADKWGFS